MAIDFQDTFTEASNTVLGSHAPDTGTGWTQTRDATSSNLQVDGANDYLTASAFQTSAGEAFETDDVAADADNDVEITVADNVSANGHAVHIYGNATAGAADYYMLALDANGTNHDLRLVERNASGSPVQLASAAFTMTNGDVANLKLRSNAQVGQIDTGGGFVDKVSASDTTITAAGRGGIGMGRAVGNTTTFGNKMSTGWQLDGFKMTSAGGGAVFGQAAVNGAGSVAAAPRLVATTGAALAGAASVTPVARTVAGAVVAIAATATTVPTALAVRPGAAVLSGVASLAAAGRLIAAATAPLNAAATLAGDPLRVTQAFSALVAAATVAPAARAVAAGRAVLNAQASVSPGTGSLVFASATLQASVTVEALATAVRPTAVAALASSATLTAAPRRVAGAASALAAAGSLAPTPRAVRAALAAMAGVAALAVNARLAAAGVTSTAATATVTPAGRRTAAGAALLPGAATLAALATKAASALPPGPSVAIAAEMRLIVIDAEPTTVVVPAENRTFVVS